MRRYLFTPPFLQILKMRFKDDELAQYNLWLDYLDALELVDSSSAPDIEWPTPPACSGQMISGAVLVSVAVTASM